MFEFKFYNLDLFSEPFTYNVTGKIENFKTKTGGIFSIIFLTLLSLGSYLFFSEYSDTTTPRVMTNKETQITYPKINLRREKVITIGVLQSRTKMLHTSELSKHFTGVIQKYERKINNQTGKVETVVKGIQKIVDGRKINVGELDLVELLTNGEALLYYTGGFVYAPEDLSDEEFWTIEGNEKSLPYSYITFSFYPCSLPDPTQCAPIESVVEYEFSFALSQLTYKLNQKKNPFLTLFETDVVSTAFNPATLTKTEIRMKKIKIMDEDRDFVKPRMNSEFHNFGKIETHSKFRHLGIHCSSSSIEEGTCVPYGTITFKSGNEVHTVLRVYKKLFSTISELGGFGDLIFILMGFIVYWQNQTLRKKHVKNSLPRIDSLGKCGKDQEKEMTEEEKVKFEEDFFKKKMSSLDLMEITTMFEGFSLSVLDQPYEELLNLLPYLERISGSENEEVEPQVALEYVLKSEPKNELEQLIKKKIEELVKNSSKEDDDEVGEDIDDVFDLDLIDKKIMKKDSNPQNFKKRVNKKWKKITLHDKIMRGLVNIN